MRCKGRSHVLGPSEASSSVRCCTMTYVFMLATSFAGSRWKPSIGGHQLHLAHRRWLQASAGPLSPVKHLGSVISSPTMFLYYSARYSAFGRDLGSAMALGCNGGTPIAPYTAKGGSLPRPSHSVSGLADTFNHFVSIVSAALSVGHGGSAEANAKGVRFPLLPSLTRCHCI